MLEDKEIYELVDRKNEDLAERLEKTLKIQSTVLLSDNQRIKKSIDNLTRVVKKQNSSITDLEKWKSGLEGEGRGVEQVKNRRMANINTGFFAFGIIVSVITIIGFITSLNTQAESSDNKEAVENLNSRMEYKQDISPINDTLK